MLMRWHDRSSESGVTAIIVALMALVLFSIGALAVDLGNAMSRKRSVQAQADFAAFAAAKGGANLPAHRPTPLASDPAVIAAAAYLNKNQPQNDATGAGNCQFSKNCVSTSQLVDTIKANGEVYYGHWTKAPRPPRWWRR